MARLRSLADAAASAPSAQPSAPTVPEAVRTTKVRGREGKKMVAGWYDKAAVKQLQTLALNEEATIQDLVGEALNLLFRNRGLPALARVEERVTNSEGG